MAGDAEGSSRESRGQVVPPGHLPVTEFASEVQGGLSPFGEDVTFPLPADQVSYRHPTAADRPHLAGEAAAE